VSNAIIEMKNVSDSDWEIFISTISVCVHLMISARVGGRFQLVGGGGFDYDFPQQEKKADVMDMNPM
jgi:hypothetical protein